MDLGSIYPKFNQKPIVPTKEAAYELGNIGLSLEDVPHILEKGFDCSRSKREISKKELGMVKGSSMFKVVVVEKQDRWLLIHAGKLTYSKQLKRKLRR